MSIKVHPAATVFPVMGQQQYVKLLEDIRAHGQLLPIVLHPDGSILDGRSRHRACVELGVPPVFVEWAGVPGGEVQWVISVNLHRRVTTTSQRAMGAVRAGRQLELFDGEEAPFATLGKLMGVSKALVKTAKNVMDCGVPALVAAVDGKGMVLSSAVEVAALEPHDQRQILEQGVSHDRRVEHNDADRIERILELVLTAADKHRAKCSLCPKPGAVCEVGVAWDDLSAYMRRASAVIGKT